MDDRIILDRLIHEGSNATRAAGQLADALVALDAAKATISSLKMGLEMANADASRQKSRTDALSKNNVLANETLIEIRRTLGDLQLGVESYIDAGYSKDSRVRASHRRSLMEALTDSRNFTFRTVPF